MQSLVTFLDHQDPTNDYWQWLIQIRQYLRYLQMFKYSDSQLDMMDAKLDSLMNTRMRITRIDNTLVEKDKNDEKKSKSGHTKNSSKSKYDPPLRFKVA